MVWEVDRYDWASLRAAGDTAARIPMALRALETASTDDDARDAYWLIDNVVIVQGASYEAAPPTAACTVVVLSRCTPAARRWALELLVQLGSGEADPSEIQAGNGDIQRKCIQEIMRGAAQYFDILERGDDEEQGLCVDLLGMCAGEDATLRERVRWYLERMLSSPLREGRRKLVENWLLEMPARA